MDMGEKKLAEEIRWQMQKCGCENILYKMDANVNLKKGKDRKIICPFGFR